MTRLGRHIEIPLIVVLLLGGTAFLLKMCYLTLAQNTIIGGLLLIGFYYFVRARFGVKVPIVLLVLVLAALEIDALGNYFRMYGQRFGPIMYDEFAHMGVQALLAPAVIWLASRALRGFGYEPPLSVITFVSITTLFSLTASYEVIELWDERYFGGQRIWSTHDAPNDLQWNFAGILIGSLSTYLAMKFVERKKNCDSTLTAS